MRKMRRMRRTKKKKRSFAPLCSSQSARSPLEIIAGRSHREFRECGRKASRDIVSNPRSQSFVSIPGCAPTRPLMPDAFSPRDTFHVVPTPPFASSSLSSSSSFSISRPSHRTAKLQPATVFKCNPRVHVFCVPLGHQSNSYNYIGIIISSVNSLSHIYFVTVDYSNNFHKSSIHCHTKLAFLGLIYFQKLLT